jgi:hypothetical protein
MRSISGLPELIIFFAAQSKGAYCDHPIHRSRFEGRFLGRLFNTQFSPHTRISKKFGPRALHSLKPHQNHRPSNDVNHELANETPGHREPIPNRTPGFTDHISQRWRPKQSECDAATVCTKYVSLLTDDHVQARLGGR